MASFSEFVSWLRLVWKHWQVNLTGGVIIAALFLWQITGKTVPASVYLTIALLTFIASTFFMWAGGPRLLKSVRVRGAPLLAFFARGGCMLITQPVFLRSSS